MTELGIAIALCAAFELGRWERQMELQAHIKWQLPLPDSRLKVYYGTPEVIAWQLSCLRTLTALR